MPVNMMENAATAKAVVSSTGDSTQQDQASCSLLLDYF